MAIIVAGETGGHYSCQEKLVAIIVAGETGGHYSCRRNWWPL